MRTGRRSGESRTLPPSSSRRSPLRPADTLHPAPRPLRPAGALHGPRGATSSPGPSAPPGGTCGASTTAAASTRGPAPDPAAAWARYPCCSPWSESTGRGGTLGPGSRFPSSNAGRRYRLEPRPPSSGSSDRLLVSFPGPCCVSTHTRPTGAANLTITPDANSPGNYFGYFLGEYCTTDEKCARIYLSDIPATKGPAECPRGQEVREMAEASAYARTKVRTTNPEQGVYQTLNGQFQIRKAAKKGQ